MKELLIQVLMSRNASQKRVLIYKLIDELNIVQNDLLEFVRVLDDKVQVVSGTMHYLKIEATEGGKKKVYEAKVWVKPWENFKQVQEFKPVSDSQFVRLQGFCPFIISSYIITSVLFTQFWRIGYLIWSRFWLF